MSLSRASDPAFRITCSLSLSAALTLTLCTRLLLSAFTSGDDGYTAMAAVAPGGLWASTLEMAKFQGRFYQLVAYPLAMVPFVNENNVITNLFKIYTFLFFLVAFFGFVRELLDVRAAAVCLALFLCLVETVGGAYNPFHGLPLWFGVSAGLLLTSLAMHLRSLRLGHSSAPAFLVYALALLGYEIILLYAPLFAVFTLWHRGPGAWRQRANLMATLRPLWPLAAYIVLYLSLYVAFKARYPGTYVGVEGLTLAPLAELLRPIVGFSLHSLHLGFGHLGDPGLSLSSVGYALAGVVAVGLASLPSNPASPADGGAPAFRWPGTVILVLYLFVPNVLFGFTLRYRIWAGDGVQFYLGSLFSAFAFVLLVFLTLRVLLARFNSGPGWMMLAGTATFLLFTATYANSRNSENFFEQSRLMSARWSVADWVVQTISTKDELAGLRNDQSLKICGRGFSHNVELPVYFSNPDMIADVEIYWSRYFSRRLGRGVEYVGKPKPDERCSASLALSYRTGLAQLKAYDRTETLRFR